MEKLSPESETKGAEFTPAGKVISLAVVALNTTVNKLRERNRKRIQRQKGITVIEGIWGSNSDKDNGFDPSGAA